MITSISFENFKSLDAFDLGGMHFHLSPFTCLIGLNGSGKTSLLQGFDFCSQLMSGTIEEWLKRREWKSNDLLNHLSQQRVIYGDIEFYFKELGDISWTFAFNPSLMRCTHEDIFMAKDRSQFVLEDGRVSLFFGSGKTFEYPKGLSYKGSVLSILDTETLHPAIHAVKTYLSGLRSLDMLTPQAMRRRAKEGEDIGYGGERLSAYLHGLSKTRKEQLLTALQNFYPQVEKVETSALRAGWKELKVTEGWRNSKNKPLLTDARHLNDGMLRILAILAQTLPPENGEKKPSKKQLIPQCLLFDEIENGINPELMPKLVAHLLQAPQQIFVTTHSPSLLNWLPDDIAKEAVILLYRDANGGTKAVRFFDLPTPKKRLELLGPGEVFVDVDLEAMTQEALALDPTRP